MSEASGEQSNYGYAANLSFDNGLTEEEIMRRAQQEPLARPSGLRDDKGYWDKDGLYWYDQPLPTRPVRIDFYSATESGADGGTPLVLRDITIESTAKPEDVDARYRYIKEGVSPGDVVDWVRSAQRGTNIVLRDKLAGYEPDA